MFFCLFDIQTFFNGTFIKSFLWQNNNLRCLFFEESKFVIFKCALQIFYSLKAYCFGWESLDIFLATQGQRLPGAAGVRTPDPQIPSLKTSYI